MKYHHKKCKESYKKALHKWKVQCSKLKKTIPALKTTGDIFVSDYSMKKDVTTQAQVISDNGSYSTACRKAVYYCLEYEVPITAACSVIKAAVRELSGDIICHANLQLL